MKKFKKRGRDTASHPTKLIQNSEHKNNNKLKKIKKRGGDTATHSTNFSQNSEHKNNMPKKIKKRGGDTATHSTKFSQNSGHKNNNMPNKIKFHYDDDDDYIQEEIYNEKPVVEGKKWYDLFKDEVQLKEAPELPDSEVQKLKAEAQKLLEQETATHKTSKSPGRSDRSWINTFMNKGTHSDRIAAQTVAIQDSPVHTLPLLRNVVSIAKIGKKHEGLLAIETLTELFLSDLLKKDEKLRTFEKCPLANLDKLCSGNRDSRKSRLIHWYYEDQLKELYRTFVSSLFDAAKDTVERTQNKAITAMYKLLVNNPEQEDVLLKNLVNKFGDPNAKVASAALYRLKQLLNVHPNMQTIVMKETEKFLFRPNVGIRAQHYGICFLTQFVLTIEDVELARALVEIYFSFFKKCVKTGECNSRLMHVLLIGVNRAFPYAKQDIEKMKGHIDTMYRVVHHANFNVSVFTLKLLFHVTDFSSYTSDRFYGALYRKLLDPTLSVSSNQAIFLNMLFRVLKGDDNINRVRVFVKRILQICCYLPVHQVCSLLYMISQLIRFKKDVLVLQAVKKNIFAEDDDEHYEDVKTEDTEELSKSFSETVKSEEQDVKLEESDISLPSVPTWCHRLNVESITKMKKDYDPFHRNPSYGGGEYCVYVELLRLTEHYHPTVVLFAKYILKGETNMYNGDPLQDFTLLAFLNRFVFRNPKQNVSEEILKWKRFIRKKTYLPSGLRSIPINSENYLNKDISEIPNEEVFIYKYLKQKKEAASEIEKKKKEDGYDSDASSVGSEDFNEMLDKMLSKKGLDFADDVVKSKTAKRHKGSKEEDDDDDDDDVVEEDEDDDDDDGDESGEEEKPGKKPAKKQFSHKNMLNKDFDEDEIDNLLDEDLDDDAEAIDFDGSGSDLGDEDSELDFSDEELTSNKKQKKRKEEDVFVSAEKFSEMLENMGAAGRKMSGSKALSNKDNAGENQLKWETNRDFWMKKSGSKGGRNSNNKRKWQGDQGGRRNEKNVKKSRKK